MRMLWKTNFSTSMSPSTTTHSFRSLKKLGTRRIMSNPYRMHVVLLQYAPKRWWTNYKRRRQTLLVSIPLTLECTPHTKLRQQTTRALNIIKTATQGELCDLILRFLHGWIHTHWDRHCHPWYGTSQESAQPSEATQERLATAQGWSSFDWEADSGGILERWETHQSAYLKHTPQQQVLVPSNASVFDPRQYKDDAPSSRSSVSEISISSFRSQQSRRMLPSRVEPRLQTTWNPSWRFPVRPLEMPLRNRNAG